MTVKKACSHKIVPRNRRKESPNLSRYRSKYNRYSRFRYSSKCNNDLKM